MLDKDILKEYIEGFYGYGNWESDIWFIGIEEGGGNSKEEIKRRLDSWLMYRTDLLDNKKHSQYIGSETSKFFEIVPQKKSIQIQSTWKGLIRLQLGFDDKNEDREIVRNFQANEWGQLNSKNIVSNLLALPSPNLDTWHYSKWCPNIDYLSSREACIEYSMATRIKYFKQKIQSKKPKAVIMYGEAKQIKAISKLQSELAGVDSLKNDFEKKVIDSKSVHFYFNENDTCFVHLQYSSRASSSLWYNTGKFIKEKINKRIR